MKKLTTLIIIFVCISSCNHETNKKRHDIVTYAVNNQPADTLAVYNVVLDILIKKHTYYRYLGKEGENLYLNLIKHNIDSITYFKDFKKLHDRALINDLSKKTLYMIDGDFKDHEHKVNGLLFPKDFEVDFNLANKKTNTPHGIDIKAFKSNIVNIKPVSEMNEEESGFIVGELTLSSLYLNKDGDYGILYFGFVCGEKCGEGNILLIKKIESIWTIEKFYPLWEM